MQTWQEKKVESNFCFSKYSISVSQSVDTNGSLGAIAK